MKLNKPLIIGVGVIAVVGVTMFARGMRDNSEAAPGVKYGNMNRFAQTNEAAYEFMSDQARIVGEMVINRDTISAQTKVAAMKNATSILENISMAASESSQARYSVQATQIMANTSQEIANINAGVAMAQAKYAYKIAKKQKKSFDFQGVSSLISSSAKAASVISDFF